MEHSCHLDAQPSNGDTSEHGMLMCSRELEAAAFGLVVCTLVMHTGLPTACNPTPPYFTHVILAHRSHELHTAHRCF